MEKMKSFKVAGITFRNNPTDTKRRVDLISAYCHHGSKFELHRDPENEFDENAIQVRQVFKSGGSIQLGYVPKALAAEWAPLMDNNNMIPEIKFGMKFVNDKTGECRGLQLRYQV